MLNKIKQGLLNFKFILAVYIAVASLISFQQYFAGDKISNGKTYTHYENYIIFTHSYQHLADNQNPYQPWPDEQWDLYKYSPSFAVIMYPFSLLPDVIGLLLWNLLNALFLFFAIRHLKLFDEKWNAIMLLFVLPELVVSLQNSQSNGLIAGLLIASFNALENKNFIIATLLVTISVYIKIFGILAFLLCLLYKERWKSILAATAWMIITGLLPLLVINLAQLKADYSYWGAMLANDQSVSVGLSVLGWLKTWFNYDAPKNWVTLTGIILLCLPLIRIKLYNVFKYRMLLLASILIWVVIFNHKAESPTFVIAISGAALWYFMSMKTRLNTAVLALVFIFSSLSPTDLFPKYIRENYVAPYVLKAVPLIILWLLINVELHRMRITIGSTKAIANDKT